MKNYLIYGFKASGKTTYASKLAKELNIKHIDLDQELLKDYDFDNIFDLYNILQGDFREIEYKKLCNIIDSITKNIVLSVGGSTLLNKKIDIKKLKELFEFRLVDTDFDIIYQRIKKQKTIYNKYSYNELKSIYDERMIIYKVFESY